MFKEPKIEKNIKEEAKKTGEAIVEAGDKLRYALNTVVSTRGIEDYKDILQIPITREFLGEKVLDLGSGVTGRFAKEAAEQGIEIYSLTPAFNEPGKRKFLKSAECLPTAGLVQDLPYKSNVFDSVLSVWAVPAHIPEDKKNYIESFKEIVRVLKPGGRAFLAPILRTYDFELVEHAINKIKKEQPLKNEFKEGRRGTILIITKSENVPKP